MTLRCIDWLERDVVSGAHALAYVGRISSVGGTGVIGTNTHPGTITRVDGTVSSMIVALHHNSTGLVVRAARSSPTGEWEIGNLRLGVKFFARIYDPDRVYNGAVMDWLEPVVPGP